MRQQGFEGSICMIGRDTVTPYERPPLSKEYLAREKPFERIMLRPASFWAEKNVDLRRAAEVVLVEAEEGSVALSGGESMGFGELIWAAGGNPRRLSCSGADLAGIHSVRDKGDVDDRTATHLWTPRKMQE